VNDTVMRRDPRRELELLQVAAHRLRTRCLRTAAAIGDSAEYASVHSRIRGAYQAGEALESAIAVVLLESGRDG
jgi:hypothetical protein